MLTRIDLRHFKCFELLKLPLAPLTILSGANASGKSSVLQALVLLHQTMQEHEWSTRLMLNGNIIQLGTVADVVDDVHGRNAIEIGLADEERPFHWTFEGERAAMSMPITRVATPEGSLDKEKDLQHLKYLLPSAMSEMETLLAERVRDLTYITAERIGPRDVYALKDKQNTPAVGPKGEHAASVLYSGLDDRVLAGLILEEATPGKLKQLGARMRTFFPGFDLEIDRVPKANAVTLSLKTSDASGFHRPTHVGFGLTQVFPIVVAALSASKEDILLIENPEVHLHPAGQATMGQFLADAARAGVQIIVETHSDHVLNGVRRAVKSEKLKAEGVVIHFFQSRYDEESQVISPTLDRTGNIDHWPKGFFDQFDEDTNYFAGWGD